MAHTFLSLDMILIPQSTKDNVPTFWHGMFSKDNSRMLIDGRNLNGDLVHPQEVLSAWLQWSDSPLETQELIISTAVEYTAIEIKTEQQDRDSIWYAEQEGDI